jgi:hypothetical protein
MKSKRSATLPLIIYFFIGALGFSERAGFRPSQATVESVTAKDQKASLNIAPLLKDFFENDRLHQIAADAADPIRRTASGMHFDIMIDPGPGKSDVNFILRVELSKEDEKLSNWILSRLVEFAKRTLQDANFEAAKEKLKKELIAGPPKQ